MVAPERVAVATDTDEGKVAVKTSVVVKDPY